MTRNFLLALCVALALLTTSYFFQGPTAGGQQPAARPKWEYKALARVGIEHLAPSGSKEPLTDGLNALGNDGWELVTIAPPSESGVNPKFTTPATYLFKRSK
jgi:hypothetical protein